MHYTAGIGVVNRAHVPEILREAGPKVVTSSWSAERFRADGFASKGMHVINIAAKSNINPRKLCESFMNTLFALVADTRSAPLLRFLAVRCIFKEVAPDVFANNRLSLLMDTGKSVEEILREYVASCCVAMNQCSFNGWNSPIEKYTGSNGIGAIVSFAYVQPIFQANTILMPLPVRMKPSEGPPSSQTMSWEKRLRSLKSRVRLLCVLLLGRPSLCSSGCKSLGTSYDRSGLVLL
jgi:hypothetical protein